MKRLSSDLKRIIGILILFFLLFGGFYAYVLKGVLGLILFVPLYLGIIIALFVISHYLLLIPKIFRMRKLFNILNKLSAVDNRTPEQEKNLEETVTKLSKDLQTLKMKGEK